MQLLKHVRGSKLSLMNTFDFPAFLARVEGFGLLEVLAEANSEYVRAERASSGTRRAPRNRDAGSVNYGVRIKQFMFFLQSGSRPGGAEAADLRLYLPVVRRLVEKDQLPSAFLEALNPTAA